MSIVSDGVLSMSIWHCRVVRRLSCKCCGVEEPKAIHIFPQPLGCDAALCYGFLWLSGRSCRSVSPHLGLRVLICAFSPSTDSQGYDLSFSQRMRRRNMVQTRLCTRLGYMIHLGLWTMMSHGAERLGNSAQSPLTQFRIIPPG